jgi:hypothetical protein
LLRHTCGHVNRQQRDDQNKPAVRVHVALRSSFGENWGCSSDWADWAADATVLSLLVWKVET